MSAVSKAAQQNKHDDLKSENAKLKKKIEQLEKELKNVKNTPSSGSGKATHKAIHRPNKKT